MIGICSVVHETGWSITNDALFDTDKLLIVKDEKKYSKAVLTIKLNGIFDAIGQLIEGKKVECIFKSDGEEKHAFVGIVKSRGKQLTVIHELVKIDHYYNEILNKIKKWQIQQTSRVI